MSSRNLPYFNTALGVCPFFSKSFPELVLRIYILPGCSALRGRARTLQAGLQIRSHCSTQTPPLAPPSRLHCPLTGLLRSERKSFKNSPPPNTRIQFFPHLRLSSDLRLLGKFTLYHANNQHLRPTAFPVSTAPVEITGLLGTDHPISSVLPLGEGEFSMRWFTS